MVTPARLLEGTAVSTPGAGTLYTAPVNQTALIKKLVFANTTNGALTVSVYLVPLAGAAGAGNAVRTTKTIAPYDTFECYEAENQVLPAGDFLAAAASGAGVTATASGLLIT
jgi:hypothetical protein